MHGYAAAIDLNLKVRDDRLWAGKGKTIPCNNWMRPGSSASSSATDSFGAASGVTTIPCISSTGRISPKVNPLAGGVLTPS
ncbi:hypothetical protein ACVIHH_005750 [Bradyrhizobium sp. USDA 4518]|uniref:Uncharacterized protein n=1 Tax=Bradyrhizobium brasilense TaxID=1419277 RepID=A0ABY8JGK5_9BRAD|nr:MULTISPECIES: hypothetical protein [Bradyrhizobium]MCP1829631.1 hypothetical protein [Bradyrhizobium sp. USDA 4545]MCP1922740.1 hypothetical protein [Bradyrhizobium sp. USDA 4532]WFU64730.1 hypothetical protein QA636_04020 [Bradyrhizobium brasilense]